MTRKKLKKRNRLDDYIQAEIEAMDDSGELTGSLNQDEMSELVEEVILRLDSELKEWIEDFLAGEAEFVAYNAYDPDKRRKET